MSAFLASRVGLGAQSDGCGDDVPVGAHIEAATAWFPTTDMKRGALGSVGTRIERLVRTTKSNK
jgi:hypothetical protein